MFQNICGALTRRSALTIEMRNVPFAEQKAIARDLIKAAPRLVGVAIDATGQGANLAEDLGVEFGLYDAEHNPGGLVWAISLSTTWYNDNMPPLKDAFESGAIWLVRDAEHVIDLRLVKVIRGVPKIPDERVGEVGKKRHGDFAVALALAYFASRLQWHEYDYKPVPKTPSQFEEKPSSGPAFQDEAYRPATSFRMAHARRTPGIF